MRQPRDSRGRFSRAGLDILALPLGQIPDTLAAKLAQTCTLRIREIRRAAGIPAYVQTRIPPPRGSRPSLVRESILGLFVRGVEARFGRVHAHVLEDVGPVTSRQVHRVLADLVREGILEHSGTPRVYRRKLTPGKNFP